MRRTAVPAFILGYVTLWGVGTCQSSNGTLSSKRGWAYHGDDNHSDNNLLLSPESPIAWYYTWSLNTAPSVTKDIMFVPLVHGLDDASDSDLESNLSRLPGSSTHLLTYNEPDGTTGSGGSSISPEDAAKSYLDNIVPLRTADDRTWNISHPVVTGSPRGLDWLRDFNESCYDLEDSGCPADFVAVHWYGEFAGLASWLGDLNEFYNPPNSTGPELKLWVTEMALPDKDEDATVSMLNQSLRYLDGLDYVEAYAWFGAFRTDEANEWTGDEVSFFDSDGGLTEVGSLYLGGEERGFETGMGSSTGGTPPVPIWAVIIPAVATLITMYYQ